MSRTNRTLVITDTNQAYFAKMSSCGGRSNLFYLTKYLRKGKGERERKGRIKEVMKKVI